ncbi:MAG TPA: LacI family DNA-binding transcriptional regulator [Devosia sp.]|jgi:LacI family transcriptional regulator|nr:LacI family DNA-binding transcriptional regulator [Devosia sp.]
MDQVPDGRRATVHDVARTAGVSLATVDRVLNARPGVRPETAQKVETAIQALDFRRDLSASLLARARDLRIVFLIPDGGNAFMASLTAAIGRRLRASRNERLALAAAQYHALDPSALVARLDGLDGRQTDCAVIVAPDDPAVARAIDAATRRGVAVITLVSDLPGSARRHFIGIDNQAAGRTAAALLGRFCPAGKIGVIVGSPALRDHRERFEGFAGVLGREFPGLEIVGPREGFDDDAQTEAAVLDLVAAHHDLAGIYTLGAGNAGLVAALGKAHRAGNIRVVAHELTETTRAALRAGTLDVVLDQNPDGEIRAAVAAARQVALSPDAEIHSDPIEIGIFLRDNLP